MPCLGNKTLNNWSTCGRGYLVDVGVVDVRPRTKDGKQSYDKELNCYVPKGRSGCVQAIGLIIFTPLAIQAELKFKI